MNMAPSITDLSRSLNDIPINGNDDDKDNVASNNVLFNATAYLFSVVS